MYNFTKKSVFVCWRFCDERIGGVVFFWGNLFRVLRAGHSNTFGRKNNQEEELVMKFLMVLMVGGDDDDETRKVPEVNITK